MRSPALLAATRGSPLALWQARHVAALLAAHGVEVEPLVVSTEGDRRTTAPLSEIGGKGVFVTEVQSALRDGRASIAVHSAKDMPAVTPDGLRLAAALERADPRDALVGRRLSELEHGAVVATGSARRRVQLLALRPDLSVVGLRGNMSTRLARVGEVDAVVVAAAALDRLGSAVRIAERLDVDTMIPQVGQGVIAVECRADDASMCELLAEIEHAATRRLFDTERAVLAGLGGDCTMPVGAHATAEAGGSIVLRAILEADGVIGRVELSGVDPQVLGAEAVRRLRHSAR